VIVSAPPDLTRASDEDVITLARQGKEEGYRELLRRYQRPVYHLIYGIVRDREAAEDLTQETFVRAFDSLGSFRRNRRFAPWILKTAQNAAFNELKRQRLDTVALEGSPFAHTPDATRATAIQVANPSQDTTTGSQSLPPAVDPRELRARIEQAVGRLREMYRLCVTLRHIEERSYGDIAETLGLPLGTVKTYLHRARKEIRNQLKDLAGPVRDYLRYLRRRPARTPTPPPANAA
jgi:RNA polymerase sigma-70 factor (ECF subfamily)